MKKMTVVEAGRKLIFTTDMCDAPVYGMSMGCDYALALFSTIVSACFGVITGMMWRHRCARVQQPDLLG
jgi:hypothetical protein